jgi:hypothetical protein
MMRSKRFSFLLMRTRERFNLKYRNQMTSRIKRRHLRPPHRKNRRRLKRASKGKVEAWAMQKSNLSQTRLFRATSQTTPEEAEKIKSPQDEEAKEKEEGAQG